jgi:acyl-CoA synthetase (AMP-forming)/AMP-acid ligase II
MNLTDVLAAHARSRAGHPAIVADGRVVTYGDLRDRVWRAAAGLRRIGVASGDVVGVGLADTAEHLLMMLAVARLGAVLLPIDWRWTPGEQGRVAEFFGATRAVMEPGAALDNVPVLAAGADWWASLPPADDAVFDGSDDPPFLISLSSGTTGRPRGPRISHSQMQARFLNQYLTLTFTSHDRYLCATPLYFGGGRTFCLSYLNAGATVVLKPPPFEPPAMVAALREHRITTTFMVPTMLRRLLDLAGDAGPPLLADLRVLLSSGAPLSADERRAIRARLCPNFMEYYASTEGGGVTVLLPRDQDARPDSVGRPVFCVDVEIVDEQHRPLPVGEVGAIRYRGPGCAEGFYRDPEASLEAFRDGWFYPGDLGCIDAEGFLFLRGRRKDMIIRGGINIYPLEIEQVLAQHPAVVEAAVVGWPASDMGEEVAAFVVVRATVTADALIEHCRERLAPYKLPKRIEVIEALPRNSSGKVVKTALVERLPQFARKAPR